MGILKKVYDWLHPQVVEPPTTTDEMQALADEAVQKAVTDLRQAQDKRPEIKNLVSKIDYQLNRNHFGELVEASMKGRG